MGWEPPDSVSSRAPAAPAARLARPAPPAHRAWIPQLDQLKSAELPQATQEQLDASRIALAPHFAAWPEPVREPLIEYHLASWRIGWEEDKNLHDVVADELRAGAPLPDVPLIVLSAMGIDPTQAHLWSEQTVREMNQGKRALHAGLAASVRRGEHRVLDDAGHGWIFEERPDAVLAAVSDLLAATVATVATAAES